MKSNFVHVGNGHLVQVQRLLAVITPSSASGRRISKGARESGRFVDATLGKGLRTLLLLDNNLVVGSMISARTMQKRLGGTVSEDDEIKEEELSEEAVEGEEESSENH